MDPFVLFDGVACPDGTGPLPLDDLALVNGIAVFEVLRTYRRAPFKLDVHLRRLAFSASWCDIAWHAEVGDEIIAAAAAIAEESQVSVFFTASGHRIVRSRPLDLSRVGTPIRLATRDFAAPEWLPGRVKHTSRAAWVMAARKAGVDEVLWRSPRGDWTECNRSNLFVVRGGVLCTPADDGRILQGVTRDTMIEVARDLGLDVREERVDPGPCDEMYVCSTLKELAPVAELDGAVGPGGGPVGTRLLEEFRRRYDGAPTVSPNVRRYP